MGILYVFAVFALTTRLSNHFSSRHGRCPNSPYYSQQTKSVPVLLCVLYSPIPKFTVVYTLYSDFAFLLLSTWFVSRESAHRYFVEYMKAICSPDLWEYILEQSLLLPHTGDGVTMGWRLMNGYLMFPPPHLSKHMLLRTISRFLFKVQQLLL